MVDREQTWVEYRHPTLGFRCRCPRTWAYGEDVLGAATVFVQGDGEARGDFRANINIVVEPGSAAMSQEDVFEAQVDALPRQLTDPILLDRETVEVAGRAAQRILVAYRQGPHALTLEQWCVPDGARTLYVSSTSTTDEFTDQQSISDAIVASFAIDDV